MKQATTQAIINYNQEIGQFNNTFCDYNSLEKVDGKWIAKFRTAQQTFETRETRILGKTLKVAIKTIRSWS